MNDRFKFRVWAKPDEKTNTDGYCVDDADYMVMNSDGTAEITYCVDDGYAGRIDRFEQDEIIVEQCTGLKDKNGNLIYDGDIIKSPSNSNVLRVYQEDSGLWRCVEYRVGGRKELPLYQLCDYGVEICGNIHENEELYND